ncbi:hypothetical protein [Rubritalea tangerina]
MLYQLSYSCLSLASCCLAATAEISTERRNMQALFQRFLHFF